MHFSHRVACLLGIVGLVVAGLLTSGSGGLPAARQTVHTAPVAVPDPAGVTLPQYDPQMLADLATQAEAARQAAIAQLAADEAQRLADELAATVAASAARIASSPPQAAVAPSGNFNPSLQPCGGGYPPCWVAERESHGDYNAFNATGCYKDGRSGCYGKWQFGWFWGGKLGLPEDLSTATPAQQDSAAMQLWNGGAGCSNWAAC